MKKYLMKILCLVLFLTNLVGCTEKQVKIGSIDHIFFILGKSIISPIYKLGEIKELNEFVGMGGSYGYTVADGNPAENGDTNTVEPLTSGYDDEYYKAVMDNNKEQVVYELENQCAKEPEINILEAFRAAYEWGKRLPSEDKKVIVVIDSGISTCDPFAQQVYKYINDVEGNEKEIVDSFQNEGYVYDLSDFDEVVWYNFGKTSGTQKNLPPRASEALKGVYIEYFKRCNVNFVDGGNLAADPNTDQSLPFVTEVKFDKIKTKQLDNKGYAFLDKTVAFNVGTAEFKDPAAANQAVQELVSEYEEKPVRLLVAGCTNKGDDAYQKDLSLKRAEAFKQLLIDNGVKASDIITIGLADQNPYYSETDFDSNRRIQVLCYENNSKCEAATRLADNTWEGHEDLYK